MKEGDSGREDRTGAGVKCELHRNRTDGWLRQSIANLTADGQMRSMIERMINDTAQL